MNDEPRPDLIEGNDSFEAAWALISPRLTGALRADGVAKEVAEDVVQETAYRLWVRWASLDSSTSVLPLALTIARNLVVDQHRRSSRIDLTEVGSEDAAPNDVEREALARVQLGVVHRLLREMNPRYSKLLLAEAGYVQGDEAAGPAVRTARTRARQTLRVMVDRSSELACAFVAPVLAFVRPTERKAKAWLSRSDWPVLGQAAAGMSVFVASLFFVGVVTEGAGNADGRAEHLGRSHRSTASSVKHRGGSAAVHVPRRKLQSLGRISQTLHPSENSQRAVEGSLLGIERPSSEGRTTSSGGFGTWGIDESTQGSGSVAGEDAAWGYDVDYRNPQCVRRAANGKPTTDCDPSPSAEASGSVAYGESEFEVGTP